MTPEYVEHLADLADPDKLYLRHPWDELTQAQSQQRDMGIALRRHADDVRRLRALLDTGQSLLLTPLSINGRCIQIVPTPKAKKG